MGEKNRIERNKKSRKRRLKKINARVENNGRVTIYAPPQIDLYHHNNHKKMCQFLIRLKKSISNGDKVLISFYDTWRITAAGGILLLSEVDRIVKFYGVGVIKASYLGGFDGAKGSAKKVVESVLNRIGFYALLGQKMKDIPEQENVKCWNAVNGDSANGELAGSMLEQIHNQVGTEYHRNLYRGAIEALSNSVEHAYMWPRKDCLSQIVDKRWWMFTALYDGDLIVLIADLGVGIPNTIKQTQEESFLQKIFAKFSFNAITDGGWIKTATLVKETRTLESNRGKGGGDLRSLVKNGVDAQLNIFSNKGRYRLSKKAPARRDSSVKEDAMTEIESVYDNRHSIYGTIVEWSIKV